MDLTQQDSPLRVQENLAFVFPSKADTGTWSGAAEPWQRGHDFTIGFGVGGCNATSHWDDDSTVASYWQVDSGRVHITSPLTRPGVSGSFAVFTQLKRCRSNDTTVRIVPGETTGRMVMEGTFATRPPERHPIRSLIDILW